MCVFCCVVLYLYTPNDGFNFEHKMKILSLQIYKKINSISHKAGKCVRTIHTVVQKVGKCMISAVVWLWPVCSFIVWVCVNYHLVSNLHLAHQTLLATLQVFENRTAVLPVCPDKVRKMSTGVMSHETLKPVSILGFDFWLVIFIIISHSKTLKIIKW